MKTKRFTRRPRLPQRLTFYENLIINRKVREKNKCSYEGIHVTHERLDGTKVYRGETKKNKNKYRTALYDSEQKAFEAYVQLHIEIHGCESKYFEL